MDLSSINSEPKRVALFDDNEDFEFKPLSEGLGFHHEEKISIQPQVTVSKTSITKTVRLNPGQSTVSNNSNFIQSDLALFYENKSAPVQEVMDEPIVESEALKAIRFAAYFIDFTMVALVTSFTLGLVSQMTGIDFVEQLTSLEEMSLISVGFIFFSYYFVYFTLLEKMQGKTFGMDLFGLKLKPKNEISLVGVFLYEMTILLGFLSFGLTNYFNLPELICGIKVIENK